MHQDAPLRFSPDVTLFKVGAVQIREDLQVVVARTRVCVVV